MPRVGCRSGVLAALLSLAPLAPVSAASWLEKNFYLSGPRYDGVVPACEDGVGDIISGFATKESRFWNSNLQILEIDRIRQTAFRPWAANTIPRRFCSGVATISDGTRHKVHYWIGEDTGFVGAGWGVEWCVVGLDRNWAYNPGCRVAKPGLANQ
ncbi:MAG: hypothetical protein ACR2K5_16620 [Pseudolabrys sp.]